MFFPVKKLLFISTFNLSLFLMLIIGIQNSTNKKEVNLLVSESINLPISFIIGVSFISGSLAGSLFGFNLDKKK